MWLLLFACGGDTSTTRETGDYTRDSPTTDTHDTGPYDRDGDGSLAADDCDDLDDRRTPGAEETWDGVDNDCDELVDGDGSYTGESTAVASTSFKGQSRRGDFTCTATMSRDNGLLDYTITCPVTDNDPDELEVLRLIMGTELILTIAPGYEEVTDTLWSGRTDITSQAGWDTRGDAQVAWTDTATARFSFTLNAAQLGMSGSGTLVR